MDITLLFILLPLIVGWIVDLLLGDPVWLPHPVVGFGKVIAWGERRFNKKKRRMLKGAFFAIFLVGLSYALMFFIIEGLSRVHPLLAVAFSAIMVFYCLAGKTLIDEVRKVFLATAVSLEEGRKQVARIVGRDTARLSEQQIHTAALETLSENLSDGVVAPMFWYMLLGVPGMFAYKMVNTLDSMIGYKNERYKDFGCWAARMDDVANYIPARLTAFLMLLSCGRLSLISFVSKYGKEHASPNSGYPEAALAGVLNCRFGGTNSYFGNVVYKPYIGNNERNITIEDMRIATRLNRRVEVLMMALVVVCTLGVNYICNIL